MRENPPLADQQSPADRFAAIGIVAVAVLFLAWFFYELSLGLKKPPDNLDAPSLFRAYSCSACHVLEGPGAGRGPNLSRFAKLAPERAQERARIAGQPYSAADYMVESLVQPDAYLVNGYSAGVMRKIGMSPVQVRRMSAYLLNIPEADPKLDAAMARFVPDAQATVAVVEEIKGDAVKGKALFYDAKGKARCFTCHNLKASSEVKLGPDLAGVGAQSVAQIRQSIVEPNKVILPSHRSYLLFNGSSTLTGRFKVTKAPKQGALGELLVVDQNQELKWPFKTLIVPEGVSIAGVEGVSGSLDRRALKDGKWSDEVIEFIEESEAPVVAVMVSGQSAMLSYKGLLTADEIEDLVAFLKGVK